MGRKLDTLRFYNIDYLAFGYSYSLNAKGVQEPLCLLCLKARSNNSMTPGKLKFHLFTAHQEQKDNLDMNDLQVLHKEQMLKNEKIYEKIGDPISVKLRKFSALMSFKAAEIIGKASASYGSGEKIIKPFLIEFVKTLQSLEIPLEQLNNKLLENIPMSRNTIKRRMGDIADDLENQLHEDLRKSKIGHTFQSDSSVDVESKEQLVTFVGFEAQGKLRRELLFLKEIELHATANNYFAVIKAYYLANNLDMSQITANAADGCNTMMGSKGGVITQMQEFVNNTESRKDHCGLHKLAIACKVMTPPLTQVMNDATKTINYFKYGLNARLLKKRQRQRQLKALNVLFIHSVRWLSTGAATNRLIHLERIIMELIQEKVEMAPKSKATDIYKSIKTKNFWETVAYFSDSFRAINLACTNMQGDNVNFFQTQDSIKKLVHHISEMITELDQNRISDSKFFTNLKKKKIDIKTRNHFKSHLSEIKDRIEATCLENLDAYKYIQDPFDPTIDCNDFEDLINVVNSEELKILYAKTDIFSFWYAAHEIAPLVSMVAMKFLNAFPTSYLCERAFSVVNNLKSKKRNSLDVQVQLRIKMSGYQPRYDLLIKNVKTRRSRILESSDEESVTEENDEISDDESVTLPSPIKTRSGKTRLGLRVRN